jgi:mRNA interferase RelE/StbE
VAKYKLVIKPSAVREIEAIPLKKDRQRLVQRLIQLADNPRPPGSEKLSGQEKYRLRQGSYRLLYTIAHRELLVTVVKVGHRPNVYR